MAELDFDAHADGICSYIDASPSPYHAVAEAGRLLTEAGFTEVAETAAFPAEKGRYFTTRSGALVAWSTAKANGPASPFRVVGGHTDSPNLRVKPNPDYSASGMKMLGVEVYGGPLLNSWLDRDLGLSGQVTLRGPHGVEKRLVKVDEPVLRVAQLAIHMDRDVTTEGLKLNKQQHMAPVWGIGTDPVDFRAFLAERVQAEADQVLGWDVMTHVLEPSRRIGLDRDLIAAPRLDNQATCYAGTKALIEAVEADVDLDATHVLVLFDHEEIGSLTSRGGWSQLLPAVLERITVSLGGGREDHLRALAATHIASADMAHATHPNYADRHEPRHQIALNGGPVIKINALGRYATDADGIAEFTLACEQAGVPVQKFVNRTDLPCGSTIGPMSSALTGATVVDVGGAMLSMHSSRELTGAQDPATYVAALAAYLTPRR